MLALVMGITFTAIQTADAQVSRWRTVYKWVKGAYQAYKIYEIYDKYSESYLSCDAVYRKWSQHNSDYARYRELAYYYQGTYNGDLYYRHAQNAYQKALYYERKFYECR